MNFGRHIFRSILFSPRGILVAIVTVAFSLAYGFIAGTGQSDSDISETSSVLDAQCMSWQDTAAAGKQVLLIGAPKDFTDFPLTIGKSTALVKSASALTADANSSGITPLVGEGSEVEDIATVMSVFSDSSSSGGLAVDPCRAPSQDHWFGGINTQSGRDAFLVLHNPDNADVVATLSGFTADGEISLGESSRVLVEAQSELVIDIARAAPALSSVTIAVHVIDGRLATSMQLSAVQGVSNLGRTFVTPVSQGAKEIFFAGIRGEVVDPQLHIVSTKGDGFFDMTLHSDEGTFEVAEFTGVELRSKVLKTIDLDEVLVGQKAGISLTASQPVVAFVSFAISKSGRNDIEVLSPNSEIAQSAIALVGTKFEISALHVLARGETNISVTAYHKGKLLWSKSTAFGQDQFKGIAMEGDLPDNAVVEISSSGAEFFATQWIDVEQASVGYTSAQELGLNSAQQISSLRIQIRTQ